MIPLTHQQIMRGTGCTEAKAREYLPFLQGTCKAYEITTPQRIAAFLSQIGHESGRLETLQENLNYSVEALLSKFGRHRISEADARRYGRAPGRAADQESLANILYGGDWGRKNLGNTEPGDGWRFRGRGLKQLTGRSNYARCGEAIGENFVANPDRLLLPVNAALSAGWFWKANGCNALADRGDIPGLTKRINGGDFGLKERTTLYAQAMETFA